MNIVLGETAVKDLAGKYIVLSLDTFSINGSEPIKSFCVIENLSMQELMQVEQWQLLHENLMSNYAKQNWNYCEQALEHLMGSWNSQLDSFYVEMSRRVQDFKTQQLPPDWSPVIAR